VCVLEVIGDPSTFKLIRKPATLEGAADFCYYLHREHHEVEVEESTVMLRKVNS
jgi:hypothetical protein